MRRNTLKNKAAWFVVASLLMLVALPAGASGQSPTSDQYDPSTITFKEGSGGLNDSVGPLPFTGFDVIAMLAVALAVTGLGLALQRAVSREPKDLR